MWFSDTLIVHELNLSHSVSLVWLVLAVKVDFNFHLLVPLLLSSILSASLSFHRPVLAIRCYCHHMSDLSCSYCILSLSIRLCASISASAHAGILTARQPSVEVQSSRVLYISNQNQISNQFQNSFIYSVLQCIITCQSFSLTINRITSIQCTALHSSSSIITSRLSSIHPFSSSCIMSLEIHYSYH